MSDRFERGVEDKIQKAMKEGQFDNLKGAGKPLELNDNPYENPDWRVANHLLKENEFTLPWAAEGKEIEQEADKARRSLEAARQKRMRAAARQAAAVRQAEAAGAANAAEREWQQDAAAFGEQVNRLNQRIRNYNLNAPKEQFQRLPLSIEREIEKVISKTGQAVEAGNKHNHR